MIDTVYNAVPARRATFKAGLEVPVHRWFRLTPSFGPELVAQMLDALSCGPRDVVLDPFSGAGTTLIEAQLHRREGFGFEINPLLHFVSSTSLDWSARPQDVRASLKAVRRGFLAARGAMEGKSLEDGSVELPPIHNPTRWWRPDVLRDLLALRAAIREAVLPAAMGALLRLGLAGALVPDLTNVTLGRLQLHFVDRTDDEMDVWGTFSERILGIAEDLDLVQSQGLGRTSTVFHQDSTALQSFRGDARATCVITSPPYPNRYSYVWNTRPHLYMLGFFSTPGEASALDMATIGGTWGTATSCLSKGRLRYAHPAVEQAVAPTAEAIRAQDNLMANYVVKYFNSLATQIAQMERVLAPRARIAYVVGCSRLKGVFVETDVLLGEIIQRLGLGYRSVSVERIRRRNSGKDLHESIVYAWKQPKQ